jgi:hypothetical protein
MVYPAARSSLWGTPQVTYTFCNWKETMRSFRLQAPKTTAGKWINMVAVILLSVAAVLVIADAMHPTPKRRTMSKIEDTASTITNFQTRNGRLPTTEEARILHREIIDYEQSGQSYTFDVWDGDRRWRYSSSDESVSLEL